MKLVESKGMSGKRIIIVSKGDELRTGGMREVRMQVYAG